MGFELEVAARQTSWIFRYDCIVAFNNPNLALTLDIATQSFRLEEFEASENQILEPIPQAKEGEFMLRNKFGSFVEISNGEIRAVPKPSLICLQPVSAASENSRSAIGYLDKE